MLYATFECGPWEKPGPIGKLLGGLLPAANPEFETLYETVTLWWLEIDEEGQVQREIGLNSKKEPVTIAPFRQNCGIFTDIEGHPTPLGAQIDATVFEHAWKTVEERFARNA